MRYIWITLWFTILITVADKVAFAKAQEDAYSEGNLTAKERGEYHLKRGEFKEARSVLEAALRSESTNPDLHALLGDTWIGLGEREKALEAYSRSILYKSRQAYVFFARGTLYGERKDWVHAIEDYSKALQIDPDDRNVPLIYYSRAYAFREQSQYAKARADYERAWKRGLEKPTAYALAKILATCPEPAVRDGHRAVFYAEAACEQTEYQDSSCLAILAAAHAEAGEWDAAIRRGKQASSLAEGGLRHFFDLCLALYQLHEPYREGYTLAPADKASSPSGDPSRPRPLEAGPQATSKPNPQVAAVLYRLGGFSLYQNPVNAIGHYNRAIELDPKNPSGWAYRAEAYNFLGKTQEAMADAKAALALNPKHINGHLAHAWCLASLGEAERAIRELKLVNDEYPYHASVHLVRAHCYVAENRFDDAVDELTLVMKEIPQCALAYAERAVAFSAVGKMDQAKRDLEEAARLAPSLRTVTEARMKAVKDKPRQP